MKTQLKINRNQLINVLCFAIVFAVPLFERINSTIDTVFFILQVCVLLICGIELILERKLIFDKYMFFFILFIIWGFFVIIIFTSSSGLYGFLRSCAYPIISVQVVCHKVLKKDYSKAIKYISSYYAVLIWINFFSMIIWRNGIIVSSVGAISERANWIFGSKNNVVYIIPLLLFLFGIDNEINPKSKIKRILRYFTFLIMLISFSSMAGDRFVFLSGSSTAIIMLISYILMKIFIDKHWQSEWYKKLTIKNICIISFLVMLVVFAVSQGEIFGSQNIISNITGLLGKNIGFSGRYSVWREAMYSVYKSPIFGIGLKRAIFITYDNINSMNTSIYSFWLTILVRYGIIGLFLIFCAFSYSEEKKHSNVFQNHAYISFILMMIGGLLYPLEWKYVFLITTIYHICYKMDKY